MQRGSESATGLGRKAVSLVAAVLVILGLSLVFFQRKAEAPYQENGQKAVLLGGQKISLEVADEAAGQTKGLSGRADLAPDEGMLFAFDNPGEQCMWMKGMNFALDMIWLDELKKIIKIEENVRPETYPDNFCSDEPAKYVIEVNAGIVDEAGLAPGQTLSF